MTNNELGLFIKTREHKVVVSSRDIARVFGKEHYNVIRDIKKLDCSESFNALNFEAVEYKDAKGEMRPEYLITRDGFTFLAMGFTGEKAAKFKEAYIEAFNAMEKALWENEIGENRPVSVPEIDFKTARFALDGVTAFRDVMPLSMKKRVMRRYYELIGVSAEITEEEEEDKRSLVGLIERFIDERCMFVNGARLTREDFYIYFCEWCAAHGWPVSSRCSTIRAVNRLGRFRSGKSGAERYWEGIRCA